MWWQAGGGAGGIRTLYLLSARQTLSRVSYSPVPFMLTGSFRRLQPARVVCRICYDDTLGTCAMQATRQQILDYIRRHGQATVKELDVYLALTSTGVRQHLTVL